MWTILSGREGSAAKTPPDSSLNEFGTNHPLFLQAVNLSLSKAVVAGLLCPCSA